MKPINSLLIAVIFLLSPLASLDQADETAGTPSAHFPETAYTFQPVVNGAPVSHSYVVKNKGTAMLKIRQVASG
jgi:hypothetical protein